MINAQNLTKSFGSRTAVDDLSFTVDKGDVASNLAKRVKPSGICLNPFLSTMTCESQNTSSFVAESKD